jgi:hypothetical protein
MTTLAGIWELLAGRALAKDAAAERAAQASEFRLRAVPREDIHLFVKPLDNTRVVRLVDRKDSVASLGVATSVPLASLLLIALLLPGGYSLLASRQMAKLQREREQLTNTIRDLRGQQAALMSPRKLDEWAGTEYQSPKASAVIFAAPEGAYASLQQPR